MVAPVVHLSLTKDTFHSLQHFLAPVPGTCYQGQQDDAMGGDFKQAISEQEGSVTCGLVTDSYQVLSKLPPAVRHTNLVSSFVEIAVTWL